MKPIAWDWDFLIHRHLEGALAGEDRKALLEKLRIDARLRRRLAEMAFEGALYPALLGGSELRPPLPSKVSRPRLAVGFGVPEMVVAPDNWNA